jgi:hypothetical protein
MMWLLTAPVLLDWSSNVFIDIASDLNLVDRVVVTGVGYHNPAIWDPGWKLAIDDVSAGIDSPFAPSSGATIMGVLPAANALRSQAWACLA